MKKLIKKCQYGTPRGGLVPHQESGSWGDRGQGNELESALENGLSAIWNGVKWVGDKIINAGDYVDRGLAYTVGLIPGGKTAKESLDDVIKEQNREIQYESIPTLGGKTFELPYYIDDNGEKQYTDIVYTGTPPMLPALPANAPGSMIAIHNKMKKLIQSWRVGEKRYQALGMADAMANSKTAQRLNQLMQEFNEGLKAMGKSIKKVDDVKLHGKAEAAYKHTKAMATDMRSVNAGRPARKKYLNQIEDMLTADNTPFGNEIRYAIDKKTAMLKDPQAKVLAKEKLLKQYAIQRNLQHQLRQLGWIE